MGVDPALEAKWVAAGLIPARTPKAAAKPRPGLLTAAPRRVVVEVDVPVRLASEANAGGTLRGKLARKAAVKAAVQAALPRLAEPLPVPAVVTLTRCGRAEMDGDNAQAALKAVRDAVAAWLGVDDGDKRVRWVYRQAASWEPFCRVRVEHKGA